MKTSINSGESPGNRQHCFTPSHCVKVRHLAVNLSNNHANLRLNDMEPFETCDIVRDIRGRAAQADRMGPASV
jgi:hypothetical protein